MIVHLVAFFSAVLLPSAHSDSSTEFFYHFPTCNETEWPENCNRNHQSPINIVTANVTANSSLIPFTFVGFNDSSALTSIENYEGNYVKVNLNGSKINVSSGGLPDLYNSAQFHLHWGNGSSNNGSEHTVDGKKYPMELHIVNVKTVFDFTNVSSAFNDSTGLAVLSFFIEATNDSGKPESWKKLTSYLSRIPHKGNHVDIMNTISIDSLLQGVDRTKYYRYSGSLTTPSCNEVVIWTVFKDPIKVSQDLIDLFSTTMYVSTKDGPLITNNFRCVQPLYDRVVTSQTSSSPYYTLSTGTALFYCVVMVIINRQ